MRIESGGTAGRYAQAATWLFMACVAMIVAMVFLGLPAGAQEGPVEQTTVLAQESTAAETGTETTTAQPPDAKERTTENESSESTPDAQPRKEPPADTKQQTTSQREENRGDVKAAQTGSLIDASVRIVDTNKDKLANRAIIAVEGCGIGEAATVTLEGEDGDPVTLREGTGVDMTASADDIVVQGTAADDNIRRVRDGNFSEGTGTVVRATGIKCVDNLRDIFRDGESASESDDNENDDRERGTLALADNDGNVAGVDDLLDLGCDEFLERFRRLQGQYGDAAVTIADVDVQERYLVCLEEEVVKGSGTDDDLPETGGLPLLGLAAFGLFSVVVGVSVMRGAGRDE